MLNYFLYKCTFLGTFFLLVISGVTDVGLLNVTVMHSIHKLRGLSPRANYTDRAAAAGRLSYCQLLPIEGCHVVSATDPHGR